MTGAEIAQLRDGAHLSQEEVAAVLNVSYWSVRNWETGRRACPIDDARLRAALSPETAFDMAAVYLRVEVRAVRARKEAARQERKG